MTAAVEALRDALAAVARDLEAPDLEVQLERPGRRCHQDEQHGRQQRADPTNAALG